MKDKTERISLAADAVARLAMKRGVNANGRTLALAVDEHWTVFVNGSDAPVTHHGCEVPRFHMYVEFNGFPAGLFSPYGGIIAGGSAANEDTFIAAIEAAIASAA